MVGGTVLTPTPGAGHRRGHRRMKAVGPDSKSCSTVDTGWALLTPGGTMPAATWPCPGPRGRGGPGEELAYGRERAGEQ